MSENGTFLSPRTQFKGETPLQATALSVLRAECKYPQFFDAAINELCLTLLNEEKRLQSQFVGKLTAELQLEAPSKDGILHEVKKLVADLNKLVVDEEETLQKAERDLCERFLALIAIRSHEPEDFTPERVEEDIRTLKARYFMKNTEIERLECEISNQKACLIRILGDALAKKLPDGSEELTVLDVKKPWTEFADALLAQVAVIKAERDALREENEKLQKLLSFPKAPIVPASSTRTKGWRQQVAEDLDKGIEQAVVEKKRRARRAG